MELGRRRSFRSRPGRICLTLNDQTEAQQVANLLLTPPDLIGLEDVMPSLEWFIGGAKKVCKVVRSKQHQPRLIAACFSDAVGQQFINQVGSFKASTFEDPGEACPFTTENAKLNLCIYRGREGERKRERERERD